MDNPSLSLKGKVGLAILTSESSMYENTKDKSRIPALINSSKPEDRHKS